MSVTNFSNIKAVLFDLDDTLISYDGVTQQAWDTSCEHFLKKAGIDIPKDEIIHAINKMRKWYWSDAERHKQGRKDIYKARREIVRLALSGLDINDLTLSDTLADTYSRTHDSLVHAFPESADILSRYRTKSYKIGLITNGTGEGQRGKLNRFGLADCFDIILIEGEVGTGKPDPAIFIKALDILWVQPHEAVMVGDNPVWDIKAPASLGVRTIWVDKHGRGEAGDGIVPDSIIRHISELPSVLG